MKFSSILKNILGFFKKIPDFLKVILGFFKTDIPQFFKENFEVTSTKWSKIIGIALGVISLAAVVIFVDSAYLSQKIGAKWLLLAFGLAFPFVLGIITTYNVKIKNQRLNKTWYYLQLFLMPLIAVAMTESLNDVFIFKMHILSLLGNYLIVLTGYFIVFVLSGSLRVAFISATAVFYGFALANCYVMKFRGTPFLPMDFTGITTAAGVANTYDFTPDYKILTATLLFFFIVVVAAKLKTPNFKIITKIISRSTMATFCAVVLLLFYGTNILYNIGIKPNLWNQARGYKDYGFVLNYLLNTKNLFVQKPEGYKSEEIPGYVRDEIGDDKTNNSSGSSDGSSVDGSYTKPNIICIMNESLSDLKALGEFTTNEDYMPFMRSLTVNTIKGNLYVPVIGGSTANSEFEFLTGHSTAFFPAGSIPYMLYVNDKLPSLVSTLEAQGYSSRAMHPYYASGWRRTEVYKNFGFDKFTSLENIIDITIMDDYTSESNDPNVLKQMLEERYPGLGSNMIVRQYISDSYNYKLLIEDFENRDKTKPYFMFNVTMQNHGGYTTNPDNFPDTIYTTSTTKSYEKTNEYLSLVKESDNAFRELISYFKNVDEPTIICMFGDHQPSIETEFISEVVGVDDLTTLDAKQEQSRHCTPFIIWANYDIEEQEIEMLSSNYLSSLVLKTAGVKLTEYDKYLLKLSETLPVIDTVGYVDNKGTYYTWSETSEYEDKIQKYKKIQYNGALDTKNINTEIFYINEESAIIEKREIVLEQI